MRPHLRLASVIVAVLIAILAVGPVAAASPWVTVKQTGTSAYAYSGGECTDNLDGTVTCEGQSIDVFDGSTRQSGQPTRKGEHACYSEFSSTFDPESGEQIDYHALFGCTLDAGTLSIDGLTSITLHPTLIELTAIECGASECTESAGGSTTIDGTWTGIGSISSNKGSHRYDDGVCRMVSADKGRFREASFEGSIETDYAAIGAGSFTYRTTCWF